MRATSPKEAQIWWWRRTVSESLICCLEKIRLYRRFPKSQVREFPGFPGCIRRLACCRFPLEQVSPWVHRRSLRSPARLARWCRSRLADGRLWPVRGLGRKLSMQWHTPPFDILRTPMESSTWSLKLSLGISGRPKNSSSRKDLIGIPALQQYVEMRVNTLADGSRSGCRGESRYGMVQLPGMSCRSVAVATSQQNTCS